MRLSIIDAVFCVFFVLKFCKGNDDDAELPYDFPDENVEKVVCAAMDSSPSDMKLNVTGTMMYEDAIKLMSWNIKNDFATSNLQYGGETDWKRPILDVMFDIFARSCPAVYVPREFLNLAKELNMIYQNSLEKKSDNSAKWANSLNSLKECSGKVKGGEYSGRARMIEKVKLRGQKGQFHVIDILPPAEILDRAPQLDLIIEVMWFAFSNAFGACFKKLNSKFNSVHNIKNLFYQDFLDPLQHRWIEVGRGVDFGIIFGDYPLDDILMNMRFCMSGTYLKSGTNDRILVRPVKIHMDDTGKHFMYNSKTGSSILG